MIRSFDVVLRANQDSTLSVKEKIDYDFRYLERSAIIRVLPARYERGQQDIKLILDRIEVTDRDGNPIDFTRSNQGRDIVLRIGNPFKYKTGRQIFNISYRVRNAVNFTDDVPEVFWNVTGHDWPVPVGMIICRIYPPPGISTTDVKHSSTVGKDGDQEPGDSQAQGPYILYQTRGLLPGEDFTVLAGFPSGAMDPPSVLTLMGYWLLDWWPALVLPAFAASSLGVIYWYFGREPGDTHAIRFAEVEGLKPPFELRPAELGTLVDEECDAQDIVATLLDLAIRGHLTIRQLSSRDTLSLAEPACQLVRTKPDSNQSTELAGYEKELLTGIFSTGESVYITDLKNRFYQRLGLIRTGVFECLVRGGYMRGMPDEVRSNYRGFGVFLLVTTVAGLVFPLVPENLVVSLAIGMFLSSAMVIAMASRMPSRTVNGIKFFERAARFAHFVELTKNSSDTDKDIVLFERCLPYAMVLGVGDQWSRRLGQSLKEPPPWFEPHRENAGSYSATELITDLGHIMLSIEAALTSTPPSEAAPVSSLSGGLRGGGFSGSGS